MMKFNGQERKRLRFFHFTPLFSHVPCCITNQETWAVKIKSFVSLQLEPQELSCLGALVELRCDVITTVILLLLLHYDTYSPYPVCPYPP